MAAGPPARAQAPDAGAPGTEAPATPNGAGADRPAAPNAGEAPAGAGATLTVWTTYRGAALTWLEHEASAYGQAFGRHVEVTALKLGEIKQRAMQGAAKGQAADVFVGVPHDQFSALADAGVLSDMGDFATERYLASLSAQAARAFRYHGTLYGLPLSVQGPALIIDTDLLSGVPASYAELKSMAASVTGDGRYGFGVDAANFYYAYGWLRTFGGRIFGSASGAGAGPPAGALDAPASVAGLRELKALKFDDGVLPPDTSYAGLRKLFLAGRLAMLYDGPWVIPAIAAAGIPVRVVPMPPLADGTPWHGFMNVDGVLVNHYSGARVAAANLAKWLTQAEAQTALARQAGRVPASSAALARLRDDAVLHGFGEALANAVAIPNVPVMGAVWGPMDEALTAILASPESDVAGLLARAAAAIGTP